MRRLSGILGGLLVFAALATANAGLVIEGETFGTATNNTVATAEAISNASFTVDLNSNIFTAANSGLPGTAVTATGVGELGLGGFDVDFWSFSMLQDGYAWFDIDSPGDQASVLHLFDSSGTLIALDRFSSFDLDGNGISETDPGSGSMLDPFIGETMLTAGTYYVAISEDPNQATGGGTASFAMQLPSFFPPANAWFSVSGAQAGNDTFLTLGVEGAAQASYQLHISQVALNAEDVDPVDPGDVTETPEPAAATLFGLGGLLLLGYRCRRRTGESTT